MTNDNLTKANCYIIPVDFQLFQNYITISHVTSLQRLKESPTNRKDLYNVASQKH